MVALSMTYDLTPIFKVTLQFEGEYLGNVTSLGFLSDRLAELRLVFNIGSNN